MKVAGSNALR